jgi:hypothetical protein
MQIKLFKFFKSVYHAKHIYLLVYIVVENVVDFVFFFSSEIKMALVLRTRK